MTTVANQSIRAILDEYYEGESYLDPSDVSYSTSTVDVNDELDTKNDVLLSAPSCKEQKDRNEIIISNSANNNDIISKGGTCHTISPASKDDFKQQHNSLNDNAKCNQACGGTNATLSSASIQVCLQAIHLHG
jgi:hypothetical protein